ncbi:cytoplasmic tRNA 2-thiolation protein 2 isoform X2 [Hyalella azteca]|uniref:Cytoplasmic tRNA 2-thiolation protein 2 n=1 Tax=Hyalella azteca TaxID=294128 RepID=A0A8B7NVV7_HYAAZ|nr:cytoplasmic tRNA 2-thiolation protein 2 isoform X2 [Hyalella azteca]
MCSVFDGDGIQELAAVTTEILLGSNSVCRKCHLQPVEVILHKTDPYCKKCFLAFATHKFRSCIGKHKLLPAGCPMVVGVSGGPSSSALLHFIHQGITLTSLKKLRIDPIFLHIDEHCSPFSMHEADGIDVAERACRAVTKLGLKCYYTTLETILAEKPVTPLPFLQGSSCAQLRDRLTTPLLRTKMQCLLQSCGSLTAQESVWQTLLQRCLVSACASLDHSRLMLGTSASAIAATILSFMAQGRGAYIPQHVSFCTVDRVMGVHVYRPLRELMADELMHYNRLMDITFEDPPQHNGTVNGCTHNFLGRLQSEFPSTVPTVFRTGDKLLAYDIKASTASSTLSINSSGIPSNGDGVEPAVAEGAEPAAAEGSEPAGTEPAAAEVTETVATEGTEPAAADEGAELCGFCFCTLDTTQPEASALSATVVSTRLSRARAYGDIDSDMRAASTELSLENNVKSKPSGTVSLEDSDQTSVSVVGLDSASHDGYTVIISKADLDSVLCYGCRIALNSVTDATLLPIDLQKRATAASSVRRAQRGMNVDQHTSVHNE